ncbi:unnamed protein product [Prunus armeniaca]
MTAGNATQINNRQSLADCAIGFGQYALGGKGGEDYIVTDSSNGDAVNPRPHSEICCDTD